MYLPVENNTVRRSSLNGARSPPPADCVSTATPGHFSRTRCRRGLRRASASARRLGPGRLSRRRPGPQRCRRQHVDSPLLCGRATVALSERGRGVQREDPPPCRAAAPVAYSSAASLSKRRLRDPHERIGVPDRPPRTPAAATPAASAWAHRALADGRPPSPHRWTHAAKGSLTLRESPSRSTRARRRGGMHAGRRRRRQRRAAGAVASKAARRPEPAVRWCRGALSPACPRSRAQVSADRSSTRGTHASQTRGAGHRPPLRRRYRTHPPPPHPPPRQLAPKSARAGGATTGGPPTTTARRHAARRRGRDIGGYPGWRPTGGGRWGRHSRRPPRTRGWGAPLRGVVGPPRWQPPRNAARRPVPHADRGAVWRAEAPRPGAPGAGAGGWRSRRRGHPPRCRRGGDPWGRRSPQQRRLANVLLVVAAACRRPRRARRLPPSRTLVSPPPPPHHPPPPPPRCVEGATQVPHTQTRPRSPPPHGLPCPENSLFLELKSLGRFVLDEGL